VLSEDRLEKGSAPAPRQTQDNDLHVVRRLRRAFLSICRCGDVVFSPYRLTTEQFALMRSVMLEPGIRQTELTNRIVAEPNTVTAMVTLLEKRGILRRKPCRTDKRVRQLFLTPHGQAVMQRLSAEWRPMREVLRRYFDNEDGYRALEILDKVAARMQVEREKLQHAPNGSAVELEEHQDRIALKAGAGPSPSRRRGNNGARSSRKSVIGS
jgi:DNA-binding MarR family transcriptional regulator